MFLKTLNKREKLILTVTIAVVSLAIVYSFILEPIYRKFANLDLEIKSKQIKLRKNLSLVRERDAIQDEFKQYSQYFKTNRTEEEEMAQALSLIEKIGNDSGVYLSNVKPQKVQEVGFYKVIIIEIRFQADMNSLSKFVYDLQSSPLLLKVARLDIGSKNENTSLLQGSILINKIILP